MASPPPAEGPPPVGPLPRGTGAARAAVEVARVLDRVPVGATVVVGASGGPDSAALLALVARARPDLAVVAAHVRHGLRDDAADVAAASAQAAAVGARVEVVAVDVVGTGDGPEAAARRARHRALQAIAARRGAVAVLLGHTADDQAETLLLRGARGSGTRGLGAMAPWRGDDAGTSVGRPLLRLRRDDVRGVATTLGVPVVEDPTNADPRFARNVVRARVLPALAEHAGDPVGALARAADLLREDADHLDALALAVVGRHGVRYGPTWSVPEAVLTGEAPAVARRVVRVLGGRCGAELDADAVAGVLALATGRLWDAGGLLASRGGGWLCLAPGGSVERSAAGPGDAAAWPTIAVRPPGARGRLAGTPPGGRADLLGVRLDGRVAAAVEVRTRRPGDRLAGRAGRRRVQDLLVDAGVPRLVRDHLPLLVRGDEVLWVPGVAVADALAPILDCPDHPDPDLVAVLAPGRGS